MGSDVLAFDDLTKGSLAEDVEYEVPRGVCEKERKKERKTNLWASSEPR